MFRHIFLKLVLNFLWKLIKQNINNLRTCSVLIWFNWLWDWHKAVEYISLNQGWCKTGSVRSAVHKAYCFTLLQTAFDKILSVNYARDHDLPVGRTSFSCPLVTSPSSGFCNPIYLSNKGILYFIIPIIYFLFYGCQ